MPDVLDYLCFTTNSLPRHGPSHTQRVLLLEHSWQGTVHRCSQNVVCVPTADKPYAPEATTITRSWGVSLTLLTAGTEDTS